MPVLKPFYEIHKSHCMPEGKNQWEWLWEGHVYVRVYILNVIYKTSNYKDITKRD